MPSPTVMRKKSEKNNQNIGKPLGPKEDRETKETRKKEAKDTTEVNPWIMGLLMFVVLGSAFLQIITNIQTQPSMSDENL